MLLLIDSHSGLCCFFSLFFFPVLFIISFFISKGLHTKRHAFYPVDLHMPNYFLSALFFVFIFYLFYFLFFLKQIWIVPQLHHVSISH